MELKKIKELIEMLETSSVRRLQLKNGEEELVLEKEPFPQDTSFLPSPSYQGIAIPPASDSHHAVLPSSSNEEVKKVSDHTTIFAPLVGIYYEASSPENAPFIKVGSRVEVGDTLCVIEAMKVLNEIKAPIAGEIKAIHVKNGDVLSYDQALIEIGE